MRSIPSRTGAQLGVAYFSVDILPALRAFQARVVRCDGTLEVAHVDDIVTAAAAITRAAMADFASFCASLGGRWHRVITE